MPGARSVVRFQQHVCVCNTSNQAYTLKLQHTLFNGSRTGPPWATGSCLGRRGKAPQTFTNPLECTRAHIGLAHQPSSCINSSAAVNNCCKENKEGRAGGLLQAKPAIPTGGPHPQQSTRPVRRHCKTRGRGLEVFGACTGRAGLPTLPTQAYTLKLSAAHTSQWIAHRSTLGHRQLPWPQGEGTTNPPERSAGHCSWGYTSKP